MNRLINLLSRDFFTLLMIFFLIVALLPHKKEEAKQEQSQIAAQGQLVVMMKWDDRIDRDIDLWVKHPMAERAVGYSNQGDVHCNLLRDDLGARADIDPSAFNYEQTTCRTLQVGEYVVNAHFYGGGDQHVTGTDKATNIKVQVDIVFLTKGFMTKIDSYTASLERPGSWATFSRFVVDGTGSVVGDISRRPFEMHFTTPPGPGP